MNVWRAALPAPPQAVPVRAEIRVLPSSRVGFGQVLRFPVRSNRDRFAHLLVGNPDGSVHSVAADLRIAAVWWQQIRMGRDAALVARRPAGRSHATLVAAAAPLYYEGGAVSATVLQAALGEAPEVSPIDRNLKLEQAAANAVAVPQGELSVRLGIGNPRGLYCLCDELELSFETGTDAHVTVLDIDTDGTATFLNTYLDGTDNLIRTGNPAWISDRDSGVAIRFQPPAGADFVKAIASTANIPLPDPAEITRVTARPTMRNLVPEVRQTIDANGDGIKWAIDAIAVTSSGCRGRRADCERERAVEPVHTHRQARLRDRRAGACLGHGRAGLQAGRLQHPRLRCGAADLHEQGPSRSSGCRGREPAGAVHLRRGGGTGRRGGGVHRAIVSEGGRAGIPERARRLGDRRAERHRAEPRCHGAGSGRDPGALGMVSVRPHTWIRREWTERAAKAK